MGCRSAGAPLTGQVLRCKTGIQSGTDENQNGRGEKDDDIVEPKTEGARAAGKHESAQGINDISQRIEMRNGLQPCRHDGSGINCVTRKEQRHGEQPTIITP